MRLVERRIGLLFAGFLLAFLVVVTRAFWLQGVQGSQLSAEAVSQQTETVMVPGLRGSLLGGDAGLGGDERFGEAFQLLRAGVAQAAQPSPEPGGVRQGQRVQAIPQDADLPARRFGHRHQGSGRFRPVSSRCGVHRRSRRRPGWVGRGARRRGTSGTT